MMRRPLSRLGWMAAAASLMTLPVLSACVDGVPTDLGQRSGDVPIYFSLQQAEALSNNEQAALAQAFDVVDRFHIQLTKDGQLKPFVDTIAAVVPGQDQYVIDIQAPADQVKDDDLLTVGLTASAGETELFSGTTQITAGGNRQEQAAPLPIRYTGPGLHGAIQDPEGAPAAGITVELRQDQALLQSEVTDANGEYLFTSLQPGTYVVRVLPGEGLSSCPAERAVGPLGSNDKVVSGFQLSRTGCALNVLVMTGGDVDDSGGVVGGLSSLIPDGTFASVFVRVAPPALTDLMKYDVILLFENGTYEHAVRVGNRVAEYVNAGGNLVIGSFYWQNRSDSGFGHAGWGALESMDLFSSTGGANYGPAKMGEVVPHPITSGVTSIAVDSWWGGVSGGGAVAYWEDGTPLAGHATLQGGQRIVAISAFPGLVGSSPGLATLYANALRWAGGAGGPSRLAKFSRP